jgi:HAMP domain-containing protein
MNAEHFEAPESYTVEQAAEILQLTPGRVRQLLRDEELDGTPPNPGSGQRGWSVDAESVRERLSKQHPRPETGTAGERGELVDSLRDQVEYLRRQLEAERQAHAEARQIIGGLVSRVPQLEAPVGHTPPEQPRGSPESAGDEPARGPVPHERETATQPRPWWRRVFGG